MNLSVKKLPGRPQLLPKSKVTQQTGVSAWGGSVTQEKARERHGSWTLARVNSKSTGHEGTQFP